MTDAICEHLNRHIFYPSGTKCAECGAKVPERQPREAKEEPVSEFADSANLCDGWTPASGGAA